MLQNFGIHWLRTIFSLTVTYDFQGGLSSSYKFEQCILQSNVDLSHHSGSIAINQPELWGWSLAKLHDQKSIHFFWGPFFLSKKVSKWWNDSNNFPMENPISLKDQNLKIVIFCPIIFTINLPGKVLATSSWFCWNEGHFWKHSAQITW